MKFITTIFLFLSVICLAQNGKRHDKIKAIKAAFITTELSLTSAEAEKFWPIYNNFEDKQFEIRFTKLRGIKNKIEGGINNLSDKEAQNLIAQIENAEDEIFQNKKKLFLSLNNVISPLKILKLKVAEENFNKKLLKQYKQKSSEKD